MADVVFYRDTHKTFECDVKIEGATSNSNKVRLVLEFSDRTYLFNGEIRDGHVSVTVPKLHDIKEANGTATLEIIADQTFFEAWQSPFQLKSKKSVTISEVRIRDDGAKVVVSNVSEDKPSEATVSEGTGIYTETCSASNKKFVVESFERFKALDGKEKRSVKKTLREFEAKPAIKKWAKTVFKDTDTPYAKYCMYELQRGKK